MSGGDYGEEASDISGIMNDNEVTQIGDNLTLISMPDHILLGSEQPGKIRYLEPDEDVELGYGWSSSITQVIWGRDSCKLILHHYELESSTPKPLHIRALKLMAFQLWKQAGKYDAIPLITSIEGYSSEEGEPLYNNEKLSVLRAYEVAMLLVKEFEAFARIEMGDSKRIERIKEKAIGRNTLIPPHAYLTPNGLVYEGKEEFYADCRSVVITLSISVLEEWEFDDVENIFDDDIARYIGTQYILDFIADNRSSDSSYIYSHFLNGFDKSRIIGILFETKYDAERDATLLIPKPLTYKGKKAGAYEDEVFFDVHIRDYFEKFGSTEGGYRLDTFDTYYWEKKLAHLQELIMDNFVKTFRSDPRNFVDYMNQTIREVLWAISKLGRILGQATTNAISGDETKELASLRDWICKRVTDPNHVIYYLTPLDKDDDWRDEECT